VTGTFHGDVRRKNRGLRVSQAVLDAVEFARTRLEFEPDERQAEVLRSEAKRGILNCSRQWGKSTVAAAKAVHRAYSRAGSLVLVASPSERQSAEFLRKTAEFVKRLGITPRGDGDNKMSLAFPNGSRIVGLPGVEGICAPCGKMTRPLNTSTSLRMFLDSPREFMSSTLILPCSRLIR